MTYAPADLLTVQRYARDKTGQPWASLGIIHSTPQGGGYHEGQDLLVQSGSAPGPQYPNGDYSYEDAPQRDLAAPHSMAVDSARLAGGDAASAFDFGGAFPRFLQFNAWMRARLLANDPRTADIREMIYTLDGLTVRRIDRTGKQRDSGDNSHLTHTHFSFFRDSLGRRDWDDNFLGLLREFFDGTKPTSGGLDMAQLDDIQATARDDYAWSRAAMTGRDTAGNLWRDTWDNEVIPGNRQLGDKLDKLAAQLGDLRNQPPGSVVISDEQLERVLRRVMGSVDGSSPAV